MRDQAEELEKAANAVVTDIKPLGGLVSEVIQFIK